MPAPNHGKTSLKPEDEWQSTKQKFDAIFGLTWALPILAGARAVP